MKLRISLKLLIASLVITLALGICSAIGLSLVYILTPVDPFWNTIWTAIEIITTIINPIAIFVVFYLIGKKFDLKNMLSTAVISIFLGLIIGYFIPNLAYFQFLNNRPDVTSKIDIFAQLLASLVQSTWYSIGPFFVAFASLALGYLRRKESVLGGK